MAKGLIAGALAGAAGAAQGMAQGEIANAQQLDFRTQISQMEEQRQMRLAERQEQARRAGAEWDADNRRKQLPLDAEAANSDEVLNAQRRGIIGKAQATAEAAVDPMVRKAGDVEAEDKARREREAVTTAGTDAKYLAAIRAKKNAETVWSPGTIAEAQLANMKVEDMKRHRALVDQFAAVDADTSLMPEAKAAKLASLERQIKLNVQRAGGKPDTGETDTEKVTEQEYDDMGNVVKKVERTEKRRPPPGGKQNGPAQQAQAKGPAVGTVVGGYRFLGGNPNDKNSWAPAARSGTGKVN